MKKFILLALLMVGMISTVRAENSATAYDQKYYSQQVFVVAYNNSSGTIANNNVVILDASQSVNPNLYLGSYINTTQVSDSIFAFGVTDESIPVGQLGRVCIRGPHKAVSRTSNAFQTASGTIISVSSTPGTFGRYTTADGTVGGQLGYVLSGTASTDTGDASNTYWVWVRPQHHQ